ncbi:hypothetical protein BJY04DRAFT_215776 [Aspergillus karnatakaensis]|uniref:uncharacterized protein n=1 Tax=Aspergillus karnatakaensis TaxID=1810916 RepID=UPI003CCD8F5A
MSGGHSHSSEYELLARATSPPSKKSPQTWTSLVLNTWLWEILATVFSLLCFATIACVPNLLENERRPDFAYATVNTSIHDNVVNSTITSAQEDSVNTTAHFKIYAMWTQINETMVFEESQTELHIPEHVVWPIFSPVNYDWSETIYSGLVNPNFVSAHAELALVDEPAGFSPLEDLAEAPRLKQSNGTAFFNIVGTDNGDLHYGAIPPLCRPSLPVYLLEAHDQPPLGPNQHGRWSNQIPRDPRWQPYANYSEPSDNPTVNRIISSGLETIMANVAASFTKAAHAASSHTVTGTAYVTEVYVSVNWVWFASPAGLVALGILFLILTVFTNRQRGLHFWKSSLLAMLFHGLDELGSENWVACGDRKTMTVDQMEETAQGIQVRLRNVNVHRGLMLDLS